MPWHTRTYIAILGLALAILAAAAITASLHGYHQ